MLLPGTFFKSLLNDVIIVLFDTRTGFLPLKKPNRKPIPYTGALG